MKKLGEAKIFGGIGALLSLFVFVPYAGPIISLAGLVLVFVAVKHIAEETKNHKIFQDYLMNFIFKIVAIVAVIIIMIAAFGISGGFSWVTNIEENEYTDFDSFWDDFGTIIIGGVAALVVAWVFLVLGAHYLKKSYNSIAEHTKVNLFKTTGTVYFIGAITLIILVGFFILFVAKILEIVSFFSLPENLPTVPELSKTETSSP